MLSSYYRIHSLISRTFFTWNMACILPAACTRNIPRGTRWWHSLDRCSRPRPWRMKKMKMTPTTIYRTYRRTSFFRRRRFLRFWTIKLTFITFACKNQCFVVDWSCRVFTGGKVNWPAVHSWITPDSRYMAKISAAAYLRMRLISEYIRYLVQGNYHTFLLSGIWSGETN